MIRLFHESAQACSAVITKQYSTSFYSAIQMLHKSMRAPICSIYGFVRLADEIVDTFHDWDKEQLLDRLEADMHDAIATGLSLNPILHAFARVVRRYAIPADLIDAFLHSMRMDLQKKEYRTREELAEYVYGSAEVVGLMCLHIFVEGDHAQYNALKPAARALGAAFQKVNFLRDLQADYSDLDRSYFPDFYYATFDHQAKEKIEADIRQDFSAGLVGIRRLPLKVRFGVYAAYRYYYALFRKICAMQPQRVLQGRVRVPDYHKLMIVAQARMQHRFNLI